MDGKAATVLIADRDEGWRKKTAATMGAVASPRVKSRRDSRRSRPCARTASRSSPRSRAARHDRLRGLPRDPHRRGDELPSSFSRESAPSRSTASPGCCSAPTTSSSSRSTPTSSSHACAASSVASAWLTMTGGGAARGPQLTRREIEVLDLLVEGRRQKEIAARAGDQPEDGGDAHPEPARQVRCAQPRRADRARLPLRIRRVERTAVCASPRPERRRVRQRAPRLTTRFTFDPGAASCRPSESARSRGPS